MPPSKGNVGSPFLAKRGSFLACFSLPGVAPLFVRGCVSLAPHSPLASCSGDFMSPLPRGRPPTARHSSLLLFPFLVRWPGFCLAFDVVLGALLAARLLTRPNDSITNGMVRRLYLASSLCM